VVTFHTAGGPTAPAPQLVYADSFTDGGRVFPADPTRSNYDFLGWNTEADGSGEAVTATSLLPGSSAAGAPVLLKAYAVWRQVDPTIMAHVVSAAPRTHGWYRTPVEVTFTCVAGEAALVTPCPSPVTLTAGGTGRSVTGSIVDADQHIATATVKVDIDRVAPRVRATGVSDGATYRHVRKVGCLLTDALSGPGRCDVATVRRGPVVYYGLVGHDVAGNTAKVSGSYRVRPRG
jgi:hypothetical protein